MAVELSKKDATTLLKLILEYTGEYRHTSWAHPHLHLLPFSDAGNALARTFAWVQLNRESLHGFQALITSIQEKGFYATETQARIKHLNDYVRLLLGFTLY